MNKKALLPIAACTVALLAACGPKGPSFPAEKEDGVHTVNIKNKEDMQADWYDTDAGRTLELEIKENGTEKNPITELAAGNLSFVYSEAGVVTNEGFTFTPAKVGKTTVAIKYGETVKHLELEIKKTPSPKDLYGTEHEGNAADPFTNEDAIKVAKKDKEDGYKNPRSYYVKGVVDSFYHAPGTRTDGKVSWFITPNSGEEKFEMYLCTKADGSALTDDDIWKGATVTAYGPFTYYGSQMETSSCIWVKSEGQKPEPPKTIDVNVAGALEVGKALTDGDSTYDYYNVTGYVTDFDGSNYYMADKKSESDRTKMVQLYKDNIDAIKDKFTNLYNGKISLKFKIKNYHGTIETGSMLKEEDLVVLEPGSAWTEYPEPVAKKGTIAEFLADDSGNNKVIYEVSGVVTKWVEGKEDGTDYGNFYLSDDGGTTELYVYGATATASALAWQKYGNVYKFTNPKDFKTNDVTRTIAIGSQITMNVTRCDYTKDGVTTKEGNGIVTKVGNVETITADINSQLFDIAADGLTGTATVNGVTFSWAKDDSTTAFRNSDADHLRVYKGSSLSFAVAKEIIKIEVTCTSADYAAQAAASTIVGGTAVANDTIVTLTPSAEGTLSMGITKAANQWRLSSVKITCKA